MIPTVLFTIIVHHATVLADFAIRHEHELIIRRITCG